MLSHLTSLNRAQKRAILLATDAAIILPALWLAQLLRADTGLGRMELRPEILGLMGLAMAVSYLTGIADTRISAYEERAATKSLLLSSVLTAGFAMFGWLSAQSVPVGLAVLFGLSHFGLCVAARVGMAQTLGWIYEKQTRTRRMLIYGAGSIGMQALRALQANPGLTPVGFVDDTPSLHGLTIGGVRVYPPVRLDELARRLQTSEVLIAQPMLAPADRAELCAQLETAGLSVATLPAFAQLSGFGDPSLDKGIAQLERPVPQPTPEMALRFDGASVLITGAGGSIGSELAQQVMALGPSKLILVELNEFALYKIDAALRPLAERSGVSLTSVLGSVGDAELMARVLDDHKVEIVLHAAAYKHVPLVEANPIAALRNNTLGTECLAQAAANAGVARFVLISTDKAVRPASVMGISKWIAEQMVRDLGRRHAQMAVSVVRFGNVLGSSGSVLPLFQRQVRTGGPVTVTDPRMERYFMSVEEAVHLVLQSAAIAEGGEVFFFDMGRPIRIEELARRVIRAAGYTPRDALRSDGDIAICFTGPRPGEKLSEELHEAPIAHATSHPSIFRADDPLLTELELARITRVVRQAVRDGQVPQMGELLPRDPPQLPAVAANQ